MLNKEECKNTSGYFKDPVSGEEITGSTPRVVECSFDNGKFVWPCVILGNGDIVKICYKCFTEEEKQLYKAYRGRDGSSVPRSPSGTRKQKDSVKPKIKPISETPLDERELCCYNPESAVSANTLEIIYMCDMFLGVALVDGIYHALLTAHGSDKIYYVPRSLIPDEQFERLCQCR